MRIAMTLVGLGRSLCASSAGPAKQAWTCRSHADLSASVSRAYPTEPRVGVGVVVLRELSPGNPETLLIRRAKAPNKGDWCFPGGSLELGETLVQCAVRETLEETGLRLRCRLPQAEHGQPNARHPPLSPDLAYPSSFIAGDAITYDDAGALAFHYAIVNVAGVPENPEAAVVPGDDAADARWFPVTDLRGLKDLVPTCDFVAEEAVRRFAIR